MAITALQILREKLTRDLVAMITTDNHQLIKNYEALISQVVSISAPPVEPTTGPISADTTYTLSIVDEGEQSILIPASDLVASAGGPFTLTITTGSGSTVIVPIAAFGDTITSGDLLFDIYVDSSGNVTSKAWEISGSSGSGAYRLVNTGEALERALLSSGVHAQTWTFPFSFAGALPVISVTPSTATSVMATYNSNSTISVVTRTWGDAGGAVTVDRSATASGRWRT